MVSQPEFLGALGSKHELPGEEGAAGPEQCPCAES